MTEVVDTREGIFKKKFLCRISNLATMSVEYIRRMGTHASGIPEFDQAIRDEIVDRYLTINDMIRFYRQGTGFSVVKYDDTAVIYQCIQDHLLEWKHEIENSFDASHAPIEDLIDLDKFANIVYGKAKYVFDREFVSDHFARHISSIFSLGIGGLDFDEARPTTTTDPLTGEEDDGYVKRDSLEELFISRLR